jgi:MFS transporter, DHA1 family, tetracycline resistance protein
LASGYVEAKVILALQKGIDLKSLVRPNAIRFIFLCVLLDVIAIGIIVPVLPGLLLKFVAGEFGRTADLLGIFMAIWALMQFFASPIVGSLSDRFGRRPVILMSNFALGLDYLLMAFAPALWLLFVGRTISGICSATIATAYAFIADITSEDERAGSYGVLASAFGIGFVIGPAMGGILGSYDLQLPFLAAAILSFANLVYGYFVLPETLPENRRAKQVSWTLNPFKPIAIFGRSSQLFRLGALSFLIQTAYQVLPTCSVLYMTYRYQWNEQTIGLVLAAVGMTYVFIQGGIMRPAAKSYPEKRIAMFGLLMGAIGFGIYGFASTGLVFIFSIPIMELWSLAQPSIYALMTKEVSPEEQGRLQGANSSLLGLSTLFGPWVFARLFAHGVDKEIGLDLPGLPFFVASGVMLIGLIVSVGLSSKPSDTGRK